MDEGKGVKSWVKVEPEFLESEGGGGHELFFELCQEYKVVLCTERVSFEPMTCE